MKAGLVLIVLCVISAALLPARATPVGAPRMALSPTISIPLPAKGKAGFALVTVTGTLQLGVTNPGLVLGLALDPRKLPATVGAASGQTKPTATHGATTVQFYVWMDNVKAQAPKQTLDLVVIGSHAALGAAPVVHEKSIDCRGLNKLRYTTYIRYVGPSSARTILVRALKTAGCAA